MATKITHLPRGPQPKPFPAWPDLPRDIAAPPLQDVRGSEHTPEWGERVADMIVGRKSRPL